MRQEDYAKRVAISPRALASRPLHAEYHYMMAIAIEEDDQADLKRAEIYYARAVELDADIRTIGPTMDRICSAPAAARRD